MNAVGILQGRLTAAAPGRLQAFPTAWAQEFSLARSAGFDVIEWLVTADALDRNPLGSASGIDEIRRVAASTGVRVPSVCLDCFIQLPLVYVGDEERRRRILVLDHLIAQTAAMGATVAVLPFLEDNRCQNHADAERTLRAMRRTLDLAARLGVRVAIESEWPGEQLRHLIERVDAPALAACYDAGNAVTFNLDAAHDLRALGPLVAAVHIKDRRGATSVALGSGEGDLPRVFDVLMEIGYEGALILETPRGDDPFAAATSNLAFVRHHAGHHLSANQ